MPTCSRDDTESHDTNKKPSHFIHMFDNGAFVHDIYLKRKLAFMRACILVFLCVHSRETFSIKESQIPSPWKKIIS